MASRFREKSGASGAAPPLAKVARVDLNSVASLS